MQKIDQLYRKDYSGEDVRTEGKYENSEWNYRKEFMANPFTNGPLSDRAVVIGNGSTRLDFDLGFIMPYKTGSLDTNWASQRSTKRFYTYGCNAIYRDFAPDFLISTGVDITKEIADSGYCDGHVVYGNNWVLPTYPGKFTNIPQDPSWDGGAIAAYLAAFDGHKRVFLLGFDGNDSTHSNANIYADTDCYAPKDQIIPEDFWVRSLDIVMNTYPDTEFVRVMPTTTYRTPELWKYRLNFRTINFRQFVIEADI